MTAATIEQSTQDAVDRLEAVEGKVAKVTVTGGDVREGKIAQAADKDGVRRFKVGRHVVSVDTVVDVRAANAAADGETLEVVDTTAQGEANDAAENAGDVPGADPAPKPAAKAAAKPAPTPKPPAETVTLTSGKQATGKTLTIRCAWVDPDKRTKKQQELFDTGFAGVEKGKTYEAMVKAAGNGKAAADAQPDGAERVIKVQDAFQVRFCPDNQKKHRNELRRRKATARRQAREAAKA
jgi:hypothetical protein